MFCLNSYQTFKSLNYQKSFQQYKTSQFMKFYLSILKVGASGLNNRILAGDHLKEMIKKEKLYQEEKPV